MNILILCYLIHVTDGFHTLIVNSNSNSINKYHKRHQIDILSNSENNCNNQNFQHKATELNLSLRENSNEGQDKNKKGNTRKVITLLSSIGAIETLYLTWSKLSSSNVLFCADDGSGGGCSDVLNGPYSSLPFFSIDIPLPVFGVLAYSIVTLLSLKDNENDDEMLLLITSVMATFSSTLVYLLLFVIHDTCPYCFLSASLSFTLSILAFRLNSSGDNKGYFLHSTIPKVVTSVLATALSSFLLFSNVSNQPVLYAAAKTSTAQVTGTSTEQQFTPPQITTTSSSTALALAKTLKSLDTKMYGAYWCSHCYDQKQTLGKEVFTEDYVTYVECDKEGVNSQRSLCKERHVPGYPTWEIAGKLFPGEQSIEELQDIAAEMKTALKVK